jgi:two-component sensor histidine kinase
MLRPALCRLWFHGRFPGDPLLYKILGGTASSAEAVSLGLIVTELVINAIKQAFPANPRDGRIIVAYDWAEPSWRLFLRFFMLTMQPL